MSTQSISSPFVKPPLVQETETVVYRAIPGYSEYCAGSDGSIRSCKGSAKTPFSNWRKLVPRKIATASRLPVKGPYRAVCIRGDGERKPRNWLVHHLVLLTVID